MGRPKKPKIIYNVNIYYDNIARFWSMYLIPDQYITGFNTKEDAIKYAEFNDWNIKNIE